MVAARSPTVAAWPSVAFYALAPFSAAGADGAATVDTRTSSPLHLPRSRCEVPPLPGREAAPLPGREAPLPCPPGRDRDAAHLEDGHGVRPDAVDATVPSTRHPDGLA